MSRIKKNVIDNLDELIRQIEKETDAKLLTQNHQDVNAEQINMNRAKLIENIQKMKEKILDEMQSKGGENDISKNYVSCFFIPNYGRKVKFFLDSHPGKLVILKKSMSQRSIQLIREIMNESISTNFILHYEDDFNKYLEVKVISSILENTTCDECTLDLSNIDQNILNSLSLDIRKSINEDQFNHIGDIINLKELKILEFLFEFQESLNPKWFNKFEWVERLTIIGSKIKVLNNQNFSSLKNLKELYFNNIFPELIYQDAFEGLINLEVLSIDSSNFCFLYKINLSSCKTLRKVILKRNFSVAFNDQILSETLTELILLENTLVSLNEKTFNNLKNLQILVIKCKKRIEDSQRTFINKNTFKDLFNLKVLNLEHCNFSSSENSIYFNDLTNLEYLSLNFNTINDFDLSNLNNLVNLEYLDLGNNSKSIDLNQVELPRLKFLQLNNNPLPKLSNFSNLKGVYFSSIRNLEENYFNFMNCLEFVKLEFRFDQVLNENHVSGLRDMLFFEVKFSNEVHLTEKRCNELNQIFKGRVQNEIYYKTINGLIFKNFDLESEYGYFRDIIELQNIAKEYVLTYCDLNKEFF
ncbi:unnamed protein product [Brachionus calyciflorus]|uniref:Uncharacterized protein n=1 Tax=Brachionus calyciflorus TaxID=104777 RepID=A0A813Y098_9BILA|nr:unnamed protein product [Brachionus calyciflorus]